MGYSTHSTTINTTRQQSLKHCHCTSKSYRRGVRHKVHRTKAVAAVSAKIAPYGDDDSSSCRIRLLTLRRFHQSTVAFRCTLLGTNCDTRNGVRGLRPSALLIPSQRYSRLHRTHGTHGKRCYRRTGLAGSRILNSHIDARTSCTDIRATL
jgi:hypothetical protein